MGGSAAVPLASGVAHADADRERQQAQAQDDRHDEAGPGKAAAVVVGRIARLRPPLALPSSGTGTCTSTPPLSSPPPCWVLSAWPPALPWPSATAGGSSDTWPCWAAGGSGRGVVTPPLEEASGSPAPPLGSGSGADAPPVGSASAAGPNASVTITIESRARRAMCGGSRLRLVDPARARDRPGQTESSRSGARKPARETQMMTGTVPPSTDHAAPVTLDASAEHSTTTTPATSSSLPNRPSGILAA